MQTTLTGLDSAYLAAKEKIGKIAKSLPKRQYGRTKENLSIIGFGGMVVKDVTLKEAANFVAKAIDRGVNYFDVAPYYGNAQQRLGPALKPYRQDCFLACKTLERDAAGAAKELRQTLKLLKTDHLDLYQLHALSDVEEVEQAFGPGGAMETITLHLPVTAMLSPGHWELFKMALDLAQAAALVPLNDAEQKIIQKIAKKSEPILP